LCLSACGGQSVSLPTADAPSLQQELLPTTQFQDDSSCSTSPPKTEEPQNGLTAKQALDILFDYCYPDKDKVSDIQLYDSEREDFPGYSYVLEREYSPPVACSIEYSKTTGNEQYYIFCMSICPYYISNHYAVNRETAEIIEERIYIEDNVWKINVEFLNECMDCPGVEPDLTFYRVSEDVRNENGFFLAVLYYDKPVLSWETEAVTLINNYFEDQANAFLQDDFNRSVLEFGPEYYKGKLIDQTVDSSGLVCTLDTELIYMDEDIMCFRQMQNWYAGGIHNDWFYGISFDLTTGELLSPSHFTALDIGSFNSMVMSGINDDLKEIVSGNTDIVKAIKEVESYNFEDYNFYYDGKYLYIVFNREIFYRGYTLQLQI